MPPSSTHEVRQIEVLCVMLMRMPSPTENGHQEKEEDEEREEDPRVTASWARESFITSAARAACTSLVTEGTAPAAKDMEGKQPWLRFIS